jgi:hypothetical protein
MRAPILCLKNRQMRCRLAGDAVWPWKSAEARDRAQRPLNVAKAQMFCKSFHAARHRPRAKGHKSFIRMRALGRCTIFVAVRLLLSSGRIPSPPSPVYTFLVHLRQRGKGSNRVNSLNLFSLANS